MLEHKEPRPIGLSELIFRVKQDLLSKDHWEKDPEPLFTIDQIEMELGITVSREGEAGINIQVLSLGANVNRQDVQTVRVTLTPLIDKQTLLEDLLEHRPDLVQIIREKSQMAVIKGVTAKDRFDNPSPDATVR